MPVFRHSRCHGVVTPVRLFWLQSGRGVRLQTIFFIVAPFTPSGWSSANTTGAGPRSAYETTKSQP